MNLGSLKVRLRFPGAAGRHQELGETASLIRELGDNYGFYHAFLAREAEGTGGRPEPADYGGDLLAYYRACDRCADIVIAESLLRRCRAFRQSGRGLHDADPDGIPLVDGLHCLISAETGERSSAPLPSGTSGPHYWQRPPSPPER